MSGISFSEILLIIIVGLIVFGPKQLPHVGAKVGQFIIKVRQYLSKVKHDIYQQSGLVELTTTKLDIENSYQPNKKNLYKPFYLEHLPLQDSILHQPELDFDQQPELF